MWYLFIGYRLSKFCNAIIFDHYDIGHYVSEFISEIECYKIEETFYESTDVTNRYE